ncbi:hypothetical protein ABKV19_017454 [Rosa sericea]
MDDGLICDDDYLGSDPDIYRFDPSDSSEVQASRPFHVDINPEVICNGVQNCHASIHQPQFEIGLRLAELTLSSIIVELQPGTMAGCFL